MIPTMSLVLLSSGPVPAALIRLPEPVGCREIGRIVTMSMPRHTGAFARPLSGVQLPEPDRA